MNTETAVDPDRNSPGFIPVRGPFRRRSSAFAIPILAAIIATSLLLGGPAFADSPSRDDAGAGKTRSFREALRDGSWHLGLRYRLETVDDDAPQFTDDAVASTLRAVFGYRMAAWRDFSATVAFEHVTDIEAGRSHANAGRGDAANGVTDRPVIADPPNSDVLEAYASYAGLPDTRVDAGRIEINVAQQRFLGSVGWRQHHQTFDAVRVTTDAIPRTSLTWTFLDRQHRLFGDSRAMDSRAVLADVDCGKPGALFLYGMELDYAGLPEAGLSTTTYGARWMGKPECECGWAFPYHVEIAQQSDAGDNPNDVDADYLRVAAGATRKGFGVTLQHESLGADPLDGRFTTPLAALHKWNGWADKFLVTPPAGLEDNSVSVSYKWDAFHVVGTYHRYESDFDGIDYGSEIDAQLSWKAPWGQTFALKAAAYDADEFSTDTQKIWAYTVYRIASSK